LGDFAYRREDMSVINDADSFAEDIGYYLPLQGQGREERSESDDGEEADLTGIVPSEEAFETEQRERLDAAHRNVQSRYCALLSEMKERFVQGMDADHFDYAAVDDDSSLDCSFYLDPDFERCPCCCDDYEDFDLEEEWRMRCD